MKKTNIVIVILVLVIVFLLVRNLKGGITGATIVDVDNEVIISKLNEFSELKDKNPIEIKRLSEPELSELKQERPVIYEDTKEGDYLIKYNDKWIVYDFENNKIIKDFIIQNLQIK